MRNHPDDLPRIGAYFPKVIGKAQFALDPTLSTRKAELEADLAALECKRVPSWRRDQHELEMRWKRLELARIEGGF
jgi:hypothetical protein